MRLLIITQKVDLEDDLLGFFHGWIKEIASRVESIQVVCLAKGHYELPNNVRVFSLGKESGYPKIIQAVRFYFFAFRILLRTDGIFVHMAPEYVRVLYPLNAFFRKPIVMWYAHIKVSRTAKWALNHVNYVLTPSKESFEFDNNKVISTGHGINTELFSPRTKVSKADLLSISRISRVKRIETLIEAMNILVNQKHQNITVDIYGRPAREEDDEYLQELKTLIKKYRLEKNIFWKDAVANRETPNVYAEHKIFVRLQGGGGFGKTELEAMSMSLPAILPTEVYKKDLGELGEDLYFQEDDANGLTEKIEKVLTWSKEDLNVYKNISRELVVKKHNLKNVAKAIVESLEKASLKSSM